MSDIPEEKIESHKCIFYKAEKQKISKLIWRFFVFGKGDISKLLK